MSKLYFISNSVSDIQYYVPVIHYEMCIWFDSIWGYCTVLEYLKMVQNI